MSSNSHKTMFAKVFILVFITALIAYLFAGLRTMHFGPTTKTLLLEIVGAMVMYGGAYWLLFQKWDTKKKGVAALITTVGLIVAIEGYAGIQEIIVKNTYADCNVDRYVQRWWPYENHAIVCSQEGGVWAGND